MPFGRGRAVGADWSGVVQQILGGWSVNGILTSSDGNRATLTVPFNHSRSGQTTDVPDRPTLIPGGNNSPVLADGRDPNNYFDVNQFVLGPAGYYGNTARSSLELAGVFTTDISVSKNWAVHGEERYVQFRAEMFNIANRANFGGLGGINSNAIAMFGGTSAAPTRSPTASIITRTSTTARQIQFALKLYF